MVNIPFGRMSMRRFVNHHMPDDGCILFFGVPRSSLGATVQDTGCLELHKISPEPLRNGTAWTTPCDLYICWKGALHA